MFVTRQPLILGLRTDSAPAALGGRWTPLHAARLGATLLLAAVTTFADSRPVLAAALDAFQPGQANAAAQVAGAPEMSDDRLWSAIDSWLSLGDRDRETVRRRLGELLGLTPDSWVTLDIEAVPGRDGAPDRYRMANTVMVLLERSDYDPSVASDLITPNDKPDALITGIDPRVPEPLEDRDLLMRLTLGGPAIAADPRLRDSFVRKLGSSAEARIWLDATAGTALQKGRGRGWVLEPGADRARAFAFESKQRAVVVAPLDDAAEPAQLEARGMTLLAKESVALHAAELAEALGAGANAVRSDSRLRATLLPMLDADPASDLFLVRESTGAYLQGGVGYGYYRQPGPAQVVPFMYRIAGLTLVVEPNVARDSHDIARAVARSQKVVVTLPPRHAPTFTDQELLQILQTRFVDYQWTNQLSDTLVERLKLGERFEAGMVEQDAPSFLKNGSAYGWYREQRTFQAKPFRIDVQDGRLKFELDAPCPPERIAYLQQRYAQLLELNHLMPDDVISVHYNFQHLAIELVPRLKDADTPALPPEVPATIGVTPLMVFPWYGNGRTLLPKEQ